MSGILDLSLAELSRKIRAGEVSPVEATEACLDRIAATDNALGAYVVVLADEARAAAGQAEAEIKAGDWKGPLHGVPVAIKDLYDMAGVPTTSSSKVRSDWTPQADGRTAADLRAAGAVLLGKTHTHEFAYGISTPTTRNPWDPERIPGGSSGGSGATVASGGAFMAMGTDTGGSIRIPAALCGTVGLKPTFGRVSRVGVTSLAWGLDHAGPLTRTVEDAAICLQALAGYDPRDPGSLEEPVPDYSASLRDGVKGLRVGVPTNYFFDNVEPEVEQAVRQAHEKLAELGADLVEVALPMPEQIMAVEFGICLPEASAYHREMLRARPQDYNDDVRVFLEAGEMIPATTYIQALRVRNLLQQGFRKLYDSVDVIVAPTVAATAVKAGAQSVTWPDGTEEPLTSVYVRLSAPANVTGLPSLSVPCGFSSEGLPIGFQAIGRPLDEATVLRLGAAYQAATDWTSRRPSL
ncbi:MAG: amidase [Pseudomonadota bacterium]